jgi:hypothetical protein
MATRLPRFCTRWRTWERQACPCIAAAASRSLWSATARRKRAAWSKGTSTQLLHSRGRWRPCEGRARRRRGGFTASGKVTENRASKAHRRKSHLATAKIKPVLFTLRRCSSAEMFFSC